MKLLLLNGPNLNFLGIREKGVYGTEDYGYLVRMMKEKAEREGHELDIYQSNYEGGLIDKIQEAYYNGTEGIIINPGAAALWYRAWPQPDLEVSRAAARQKRK